MYTRNLLPDLAIGHSILILPHGKVPGYNYLVRLHVLQFIIYVITDHIIHYEVHIHVGKFFSLNKHSIKQLYVIKLDYNLTRFFIVSPC